MRTGAGNVSSDTISYKVDLLIPQVLKTSSRRISRWSSIVMANLTSRATKKNSVRRQSQCENGARSREDRASVWL